MTLHDLADELAEVRRYVRSKPEYVRDEIQRLLPDVVRLNEFYDRMLGLRLAENLTTGVRCYIFNDSDQFIAFTSVHVLGGYLDGAVYEIRRHDERQRKEGGEG